MTNPPDRQQLIDRVLSARGLLRQWDADEPIEDALGNPAMEEVIVEAAAELGDADTVNEWIATVQGDGSNERRVQLAERCRERIRQRDASLRQS